VENLQQFQNEIFVKLTDRPPSIEEQSEMLLESMKEYMSKGTFMTVTEVDSRYVTITGDLTGIKNKNYRNIVGRAGEVAIHDSVMAFLAKPSMKRRYGTFIMESSATILIPADWHLADRTRNALLKYLTPLGKKMMEYARKEWEAAGLGNSVSDFLMKDAYPIESKTQVSSFVLVGEKGEQILKRSQRNVRAQNQYIQDLTRMGGKVVVGASFFDVLLEDIGKEVTKPIETHIDSLATQLSKQADGVIIIEGQIKKQGSGKLFQMIGLRLNMFVPFGVDEKNVKDFLTKRVVRQADRKAINATVEFTLDEIQKLIISRSKIKT